MQTSLPSISTEIRMSKTTYLCIYFLLAVFFWNLAIVQNIINRDQILIISWIWSLAAFVLFKKPKNNRLFKQCHKYIIWLFIGVFLSLCNAYISWDQSISTTFTSQRYFYSFIFLYSIFYIQPSRKEIEHVLKWISILIIIVWIISIFDDSIFYMTKDQMEVMKWMKKRYSNSTDLGYTLQGYEFIFTYLCLCIDSILKKYSFHKLIEILLLALFFLLFQNRSMLIGVGIAIIYMIFNLRSRYKPIIIISIIIITSIIFLYTSNIISGLIQESQDQLNDSQYNRWKSLFYFLFGYHPNWWSYLLGSGTPGVGSKLMHTTGINMKLGIYAGDVGMIGMWATYGIIPIIIFYSIIINILFRKKVSIYLKLIAIHILLVPTIYQFKINPGILFFCLLIYLYSIETYKTK